MRSGIHQIRKRFGGRFALGWAAGACVAAGLALRAVALFHPFWMDESFSASLAVQTAPDIVRFCRKDVHPPGYILALQVWNRAWRSILASPPPDEAWELVDFNLPAIESAGTFDWRSPDGRERHDAGVFPEQWAEHPLAPLWALRLLSVVCGAGAAAFMVLLGKELFPQSPWIWIGALALYCLSGYCILWDTVIRSYSAAAMCVAALAWASIRCARGPRWKTMGGLSALAIALGFWTNYVTLVHLPGIALAAWIVSGFSPKAFWRILGVFAAGVALAALVWGRGFLGQLGKSPSPGLLAFPILESLDYQTTAMALHYWSMAFSQAIWEWLAAGRMEDGFNVLSNLSPLNPVLYSLAFLAYGAGLFANGWALARRPGLALAALALLAFAPAAIVIGGNTILPHSFRLHGRHMAPAAPMFFLFLAHGWAACGGAAIRRLGRQAGHNRVEQA